MDRQRLFAVLWFINMNKSIKEYLAKIGAKGGKKSKRALTAEQARAMVKAREAKKLKKTSQTA